MIELEEDENGKYVIPGPPAYGRVYRVIDEYTGKVGYNYTTSPHPGLNPGHVKMIEAYSTFGGWATEILSVDATREEATRLNALTPRYESVPFTEMKERILARVAKGDDPDLTALVRQLQGFDTDGHNVKPAEKGWK